MSGSQPERDRRAAERQVVAYRLDVSAPGGATGCLLDLSMGGMRVRFRCELDVAGTKRLTLTLPRWLELGTQLEVDGRFVWTREAKSGFLEVGFAFEELSRKQEGLVRLLIQRLSDALAEDLQAAAAGG
jgi:hypothetical protein